MYQLDEYLTLGQENPPLFFEGQPAEGGEAAATGETGANGAPLGGKGKSAEPFGPFFMLVMGLLAFVIIFSMWGQRRDRKKRDAMLSTIKKHDKVQTMGGVIGSIVEIKKDFVVLKVDESSNTRITFARSAIQQVLNTEATAVAAVKEEKA